MLPPPPGALTFFLQNLKHFIGPRYFACVTGRINSWEHILLKREKYNRLQT